MKPHDSPENSPGNMNEQFDDLEQQLQSLRPRGASLHLRDRISNQITNQNNAPLVSPRWYAPLALAASLAISAMLIALLMLPASHLPPKAATIAQALPAIDSSLPSFIAYRQALSESESALAELLDKHGKAHHEIARTIHRPSPTTLQMHSKLPL